MTITTKPPAPGDLIRHQILKRFALRQADLASAMGISKVRLNLIINTKAPITPEMALRLAKVTSTEAEYWLGHQVEYELHRARTRLSGELDELVVVTKAVPEPKRRNAPSG
jgi:addiction module HigA family antidote